ncbi:MAG: helix-turn-helix domain-containing protein [Stagnimonas sp.]|nr:helix-turn-helix domain-containing protein [Stagnimonas sp.]
MMARNGLRPRFSSRRSHLHACNPRGPSSLHLTHGLQKLRTDVALGVPYQQLPFSLHGFRSPCESLAAQQAKCFPEQSPGEPGFALNHARLLQSVEQADEIVRGERAPAREFLIDAEQVRAVRAATGLSQTQFAKLIEVNVGTLRNWEQGQRRPTGPARALLKALKARPVEVIQALRAAWARRRCRQTSTGLGKVCTGSKSASFP